MIMVFMRLLDFDFYPNLGRDIYGVHNVSRMTLKRYLILDGEEIATSVVRIESSKLISYDMCLNI